MSDTKPTMILVTSLWQNQKSFRLIPFSKECPFSEGIYDPESKVLVLMSTTRKETLHMMPKLNENGDAIPTLTARANGKKVKEQRVTLNTYTEHYVTEKEEIEKVIAMLAINSDFEFKKYLEPGAFVSVAEPKIQLLST